ncbi:MAG: ABC transporter permease [Gammaproteobacteria bacterium]|nr:ABC transporter permease [Gammaproteobacteria bacterium]
MLTILAIAWATFAISTMLAIGEGLRLNFAKTVANSGNNLLTFKGGHTSIVYLGLPAGRKIYLTKSDYARIANLPNIKHMTPVYSVFAKMRYGDKNLNKEALLVNEQYAKIHNIDLLPGGRFISKLDLLQKRRVIVLGEKTSQDLFPNNPNPIGLYLYFANELYRIIGVMQHKSEMMGRHDNDAMMNWLPSSLHKTFGGFQAIDSIDITYKNADRLVALENWIGRIVARNHGLDPNDENIVHFRDYAVRQENINSFFLGLEVFLGLVGLLTLIVAGVGIANVMFATVNRDTCEIGIKMALGAKRYQIIWPYIKESSFAMLQGGFFGVVLSGALVFLLGLIPLHGKLFEVIGRPKAVLSFGVIVVVILSLGVVGMLAGFFPALKASKIDPARAVSYE